MVAVAVAAAVEEEADVEVVEVVDQCISFCLEQCFMITIDVRSSTLLHRL